MSHIKRISMEKSWPLPRKGNKYVTAPYPGRNLRYALPLRIVLRDLIKIGHTQKEIKTILCGSNVLVNGRVRKDEKYPFGIFDVLSLPKIGKNYTLMLTTKGKLIIREISAKDAGIKICKVIGKKTLSNGRNQINFIDGRNIISEEKVNTGDSVMIELKDNKIIKVLPMRVGADVYVIGGEHIGEKGKIAEIGDKIKVTIGGKNFDIQENNLYII